MRPLKPFPAPPPPPPPPAVIATDETCAMLNEVLSDTSGVGAFCAGLISGLAFSKGDQPPRTLIELAIQTTSVEDAADMWQLFCELRKDKPAEEAAAELHAQIEAIHPRECSAKEF